MSRSLSDLLEALRQGERPALSLPEIEALLAWLTGSAARDAEEPLQRPEHDPVLLQMVLYRLDSILFSGGDLKLEGAGLAADQPVKLRRIRFRRLASAFHPDRFPQLSDWLTERSQAIHRAYDRFKKNPDATTPQSHDKPQAAGPRQHDMRRAPTRMRKHRFRAVANQLRARFGNDRYLAHKLIAGLAVLALLPVLNMVLVPSVGKDPLSGFGIQVPDGNQADTVSDFRFPVSGSGKGDAETTQDEGDGKGWRRTGRTASLAEQTPTPVASLEATAGSVIAGADGEVSAQDAPPTKPITDNQQQTTSQQGNQQTGQPPLSAGAGPAGDDDSPGSGQISVGAGSGHDERGPKSRIGANGTETAEPDAPARKPEPGNRKPSASTTDPEISPLLAAARRAMNPSETVAALQTVDEQLAAMGLANDTERLYRRIGGEGKVDGGQTPDAEGKKRVSGFGFPVSGSAEDDAESEADESEGAVGRADPEASLAGQAPTTVEGSGAGKDSHAGTEPATGAGDGRAGDERATEPQMAAAPSDAEEQGPPARKPETGSPDPAPSAQNVPPAKQTTNNRRLAGSQAANKPNSKPALSEGADPAGDEGGPDTRIAAASVEAGEQGPPARKPETGNPEPAPQAQSDSELALGPLARHPAGEVLQRFQAALQTGDIPGIAGAFTEDARFDGLRGRRRIADHFREMLAGAESRQVSLKVSRLARDDAHWKVEIDLEIRVQRNALQRRPLSGRGQLWLVERAGRLTIDRMEIE